MAHSSNSETVIFCGNCNNPLADSLAKVTDISFERDSGDEVLVWDALAYIYGISSKDLQKISNQYSKMYNDAVITDGLLTFCDPCASSLTENYKSHKSFENRIHYSSFVKQVKKFREGDWQAETVELNNNNFTHGDPNLSNVPFEEDQNVKNDCLFADYNFNDTRDSEIVDSADEIEEKYDIVLESVQDAQENESPILRRSARMKNVVVKLEKLTTEDLQTKYGVTPENKNSGRPRRRPKERTRLCATESMQNPKNRNNFQNNDPTKKSAKNLGKPKKSGKYPCKVCGIVLRNRGNYLHKHLPRHYKNIRYKCDICGRDFKSRTGIKHHTTIEHGTEEVKGNIKSTCEICGKVMQTQSLKGHIENKHSAPRETYKCEPCDKTFICKIGYDEHRLTHSKDFEPLICAICGKSFKSKSSFRYHEKTHTSEKKYSCDVCQLKFFEENQMVRHKESVHTTERKFVCETCGKSFKHQLHFKKHLQLHKEVAQKGEYSVKCEECGKFFIHSLSLYTHTARFHRPDLKKKVYKCAYCEKILSSGTVLRIHEKLHQNDPGYQPRKKQTWKDITHGKLKNAGVLEPTQF